MSGIQNTRTVVGAPLTPAQLARARRRAGKDIRLHEVRPSENGGKLLEQRQWEVEKPFAPMRSGQLALALRADSHRQEILKLLAEIARESNPYVPARPGQKVTQRHLALQLAASLLEDMSGESEWLLVAACIKGAMPASSEALERKLRSVEGDENTFASLFESIVETHADKAALRKMLFAARRNPRMLAAVLRQALGLNQNQAYRRKEVSVEQLAQDIVACGDNIGLLTALADSLEGLQGNPVQNAHMLRKLRGDAHKLASFLLHLRESGSAMHNRRGELRSGLHDAIREMELQHDRDVLAQYEAGEAGSVPELLTGEKDEQARVEESGRFITVMRRMLKRYELKDFNAQLDKGKSALGAAMRAEARSEDKERRTDILNNLSSMHLSSSFLMMVEEFETNLKGIAKTGNFSIPAFAGKALISELLDIIESGNGQPSQFENMLKRLGLADTPSAAIVTLQGVLGILRTMPEQAYPSLRVFSQLRDAAQSVLEAAVSREEEITD